MAESEHDDIETPPDVSHMVSYTLPDGTEILAESYDGREARPDSESIDSSQTNPS